MRFFVFILILLFSCNVFSAEEFPSRPIEIVIGSPPGSGNPIMVDIINENIKNPSFKLTKKFRVGQGNLLANRFLASSPADGYTIGFNSTSVVANESLFQNPGYNSDDFTSLVGVGKMYSGLVINSRIPLNSIKDIIRYAKNNPEKFTYGHNGNATQGFLAMEQLSVIGRVKFRDIPYKGTAFATVDVMSGFIDAHLYSASQLVAFLPNAKLKLIATTGLKRHPYWSNIPTVAETYPGFSSTIWYVIQVRKDVPNHIKDIIKKELTVSMNDNKTQIALNKLGLIAFDDENLESFIKKEKEETRKLIDVLIKNEKYIKQ